ncbi:MAG: STAS domain-containing protein [Candidatus Competibacteraceae bacterium]
MTLPPISRLVSMTLAAWIVARFAWRFGHEAGLVAFAAALGDGDCVLDLSGLRFVDNTGLRLLFHLQRRFNNGEQELILCGVQPPVRQLLAITGLMDQFRQATHREQALGLLAARQH